MRHCECRNDLKLMPAKLSLQCGSPGQSNQDCRQALHPFTGPYRRQLSTCISDMGSSGIATLLQLSNWLVVPLGAIETNKRMGPMKQSQLPLIPCRSNDCWKG